MSLERVDTGEVKIVAAQLDMILGAADGA